jgi:hypothetical protein
MVSIASLKSVAWPINLLMASRRPAEAADGILAYSV